jgi:plastocyanin
MSSGAATATGTRAALRYALMGAAGAGLALAAALALSSATSAQEPLQITAGDLQGTAAVQAYLPGAVTVEIGAPVTFTVGSAEPHSITFGEGPTDTPPDQWPVTGWAPQPATGTPEGSPSPVDLGTIHYGGSGFINTGLLSQGGSATVVFDTAGTYVFSCIIHPGMTGTVTVVAPGDAKPTTQDEADKAGAATRDKLLGQVDSVRADRVADVESHTASDGTTTWDVFADAATVAVDMPGGGTGYLELFEFLPSELQIQPGDTVHWSALGAHTVTFPAEGSDAATLDPFSPASGGDTYDGKGLFSSGVLNAGPGAPSAYTLTFPTAGTYHFVCLLHGPFGQVGTIQVGPPASSAPSPAAGQTPATSPGG